jgi:hypothetical protein
MCVEYEAVHSTFLVYCTALSTILVTPTGDRKSAIIVPNVNMVQMEAKPLPCRIYRNAEAMLQPSWAHVLRFAEKMMHFQDIPNIREKMEVVGDQSSKLVDYIFPYVCVMKEPNICHEIDSRPEMDGNVNLVPPMWVRKLIDVRPGWRIDLSTFSTANNSSRCEIADIAASGWNSEVEYFKHGFWMRHSWGQTQSTLRVFQDYLRGICSASDVLGILQMVSLTFFEKTRNNMSLYKQLTRLELMATDALLVHFGKYLESQLESLGTEHYERLCLKDLPEMVHSVLQLLIGMRESVGAHHAYISSLRASSVWRSQQLLEKSISYPFLKSSSHGTFDDAIVSRTLPRFYAYKHKLNHEIKELQQQWLRIDRSTLLQRSETRMAKVQLVTYATDEKEGLKLLRQSARLSGIELTVVGLNRKWNNHGDFVFGIAEYLNSFAGNQSQFNEDDVIIIVDAYDVLVTPSLRRIIPDLLGKSKTPIVISGESYSFPEELLAWAYPHSRQFNSFSNKLEYAVPRAKFINAGVYAGQLKYLRYLFLKVLLPRIYFFGNDQHQWARYLAESQVNGLLRVDMDMSLSFSAFKHIRLSNGLLRMWSLFMFFYGESESNTFSISKRSDSSTYNLLQSLIAQRIMVVHGNFQASNSIYKVLSREYAVAIERFESDNDREFLLQLLWAWYDGDVEAVKESVAQLHHWKESRTNGLSSLALELLFVCETYANPFVAQ